MASVTGSNVQTVSFGGNGTPIVSPVGSGTIAADGKSSLAFGRGANLSNPSGNALATRLGGRISAAEIARILRLGAKSLPWIGAGVALYALCQEIGFVCTKDEGKDLVVVKQGTYDGTSLYEGAALLPNCNGNIWRSVGDFCQSDGAVYGAVLCTFFESNLKAGGKWSVFNVVGGGDSKVCQMGLGASSPLTSNLYKPSTLQDLLDSIVAKNGWPSTSVIPKAVVESATATGTKIGVESPTVTGPATSKGTSSTSSTGPVTTTTNTTHNHNYTDNRVTTTTTTVTVTNNTSTGQSETTTTTEEPTEEPSECEANPDSLNCSELDTPDDEIPTSTKNISFTEESMGFGGGSCPANVVQNLRSTGQSVTVIDWASHCSKLVQYVRPLVISAAAFAAFAILFLGGKLE